MADSRNETAATTGLRFECTQCGKCCWNRGEYAHVYLTGDDAQRLAGTLGLEVAAFREAFTFRDENGWTELDFRDGRCVLLDAETNLCTVYESRPTQCSTFPFWPEMIRRGRWTAEAKRICEGVGEGEIVAPDQVAARLAAQRKADEG